MISLKNFTHYSLCKSIIHPDKLAENAKSKGYTHVGVTDYNSISGAIEVIKAFDDLNKEEKKANPDFEPIKWIIGTTLTITKDSGEKGYITLYAKNLDGWKSLIKVISEANKKENFNKHPQISYGKLKKLKPSGLICTIGGLDSWLALGIFDGPVNDVIRLKTLEEVKTKTNKNWIADCKTMIQELGDTFDLYLESHNEILPGDTLVNQAVRYLGKQMKIPVVFCQDAHYLNAEDCRDHHIILCSGMKATLRDVKEKLEEDENLELRRFFYSSEYYLRDNLDWVPQNELDNLKDLVDKCEQYKVFSNPKLPKFPSPGGKSSTEYAKELCAIGWEKRKPYILANKEAEYHKRLEDEINTYDPINILDYFLIVQDFLAAARNRGELTGVGRGSAGGCMLAYLLGITELDPVKYNLSSNRFYNPGRNTKDKIALPDIDCDLMITKRQESIQYLIDKYDLSRVGQVCTFGRIQGRGAIKEVFRVNNAGTFDLINKITENIPDEAKIADELQEMDERGEEVSIILWALKNEGKKLKDWCYLDAQGKCQGEYARLFEQAIRLEGTLKTQGKHAAAIIIGAEALENVCPMLHNKSKDSIGICGFEYESLESIGLVKFDLLGVAVLDKLHMITSMIKERYKNG